METIEKVVDESGRMSFAHLEEIVQMSGMIAVRAGGNEGGIYQTVATPAKVMFSAWVFVNKGHVVIGTHAMVNQGPYSWSTKIGEWEQLRVCTDGSYPPGWFFIYNQDPTGGSFYVDKVEIRAIP